MTTRTTKHGTTWRTPVRSDHGGQHAQVWLDTRLQRLFRAVAVERGITIPKAVRMVLDNWADMVDE